MSLIIWMASPRLSPILWLDAIFLSDGRPNSAERDSLEWHPLNENDVEKISWHDADAGGEWRMPHAVAPSNKICAGKYVPGGNGDET